MPADLPQSDATPKPSALRWQFSLSTLITTLLACAVLSAHMHYFGFPALLLLIWLASAFALFVAGLFRRNVRLMFAGFLVFLGPPAWLTVGPLLWYACHIPQHAPPGASENS